MRIDSAGLRNFRSYREAAFVGNLSAGVTVRQLGQTGMATQALVLALYDEQLML